MQNYHELLKRILIKGDPRMDRTGVGTFALFGESLTFDLFKDGFPAITTKKLFFKSVAAELAGFLEGTQSAGRMRELGTKIWDANAQSYYDKGHSPSPDYLGPIYGAQWRNWGNQIDQLNNVVEELINNPTSRRLLVTAWNPSDNDKMCLPSCHTHFQLFVRDGTFLDCIFYMRSVDTFLGMPFDIASYALLTHIIANQVGYYPGKLTGMFADCHVYKNHLEAIATQLERDHFPSPTLKLDEEASIDNFHPDMVELINYQHHPSIKAEMSV